MSGEPITWLHIPHTPEVRAYFASLEKMKATGQLYYNGSITFPTSEAAPPTPLSYDKPSQDVASSSSEEPRISSTLNPKVADLVSHSTLL